MNRKIALVVTYFGKLPFYFPAFQLSCRYNPDIQWIIFTDSEPPDILPANVSFVGISIEKFCQLASDKLGLTVVIPPDYSYKVCDLKPAYGLIYDEYLNEYEFWGHCDVDIVWGNINSFITSSILDQYEIITSRPNRISGHFCLYKNSKKINQIFISMPKTKLSLENIYECEHLDEEYFTLYLQWLQNPTLPSRIKQLFCGKPLVPKIYWDEILTTSGAHQRELYRKPELFLKWKEGRAFHIDGTEMMYLHFHELKNTMHSMNFTYEDDPLEFVITTSSIQTV